MLTATHVSTGPSGAVGPDSGGTGYVQNPYTYGGGLQDRSTGLIKFGQRWYAPSTGSWVQQDALNAPLDPGNANRYSYVGGNPINFNDPTGMKKKLHLAPVEAPAEVARLIRAHAADSHLDSPAPTLADVRDAGMAVRRQVLGDAHVDRATVAATDLTAEFQDFITQYAWGSIWTRPGLDRRSRSLITLTALVARGHHEELAMHVRAARTNGLTNDEIKELLLQTAIYCGVPDANTAFRVAQGVLADIDQETP